MPLKLQIKKGKKIIINGAVIENITSHNVSLLVMNNASILRDSDILTPEQAATPASRIYYALQCLYLFPEDREEHLPLLNQFALSYLEAAPSSRPIVDGIRKLVDEGGVYQALKKGRELIAHERKVLSHVQEGRDKEIRGATSGGKPARG